MLIVYLMSLIFSIHAQECKVYKRSESDASTFKEEKLLENKSSSFFESGRALSGFKTQDQDDLGSCYANALTAAIKVSHPTHPDISYIHGSFVGSQGTYFGNDKKIIKTDNKLFNYGGDACGTFNMMTSTGGACPSRYSMLENDPSQDKIIRSLGKYLDYFNSNTEEVPESFKSDFGTLIELVKKEQSSIKEKCEQDRELVFDPSKHFSGIFRYTLFNTEETQCSESIKKALSTFYKGDPEEDPFMNDAVFTDEFKKSLKEFIKQPEILKTFEQYSDLQKSGVLSNQSSLANKFFNQIEELIRNEISDSNCKDEEIFPQSLKDTLFDIMFKESKDFILGSCEEKSLDESVAKIQNEGEALQCFRPEHMPIGRDLLGAYPHIKKYLGENFFDQIDFKNKSLSLEILRSQLMPGCSQRENLIPLDDLYCARIESSSFKVDRCKSNNTECESVFDEERITKELQHKIISSIDTNSGIVVNVCTSFLKNKTFQKSNYCQDNANAVEGHSYHAMSVTGYRCSGGKIQYQIQNSWGRTCPNALDTNIKNDFMECELDQDGIPTGRFWVNEEVLFDSTTSLNVIEKP